MSPTKTSRQNPSRMAVTTVQVATPDQVTNVEIHELPVTTPEAVKLVLEPGVAETRPNAHGARPEKTTIVWKVKIVAWVNVTHAQ